MVRFQPFKLAAMSFISLAVLAASPASAAGSCGGFYAVDAPTTLNFVARACRVTLASLREANPGVNPGNVRPGEHLAVPTSISHHAAATALSVDANALANRRIKVQFTEDLGFRERTRQRLRILAAGAAPGAPEWSVQYAGGKGHFSSTAPISFQKIAALRIETASAQNAATPILINDGIPPAQFADRSSVSRGYRLPDYSKIGVSPPVLVTPAPAETFLSGKIVSAEEGCFTLVTTDGKIWRLAASILSDELLGKTVTVWGSASNGTSCGGGQSLSVSHAIYADSWF